MKINEAEFNKSTELLKGVKLTESEKTQMLSDIYQADSLAEPPSIASPFMFSSFFVRERMLVTMASFIFIVMGSGYAAAGSLPGDPLYGIKVNVLEPIALQLTFDETERNEYKIKLLQKRVTELQALKINSGTNLASEEESHHAAEKIMNELETSAIFDEDGVNVDIEASVETYNSLISETFRLETKVMKTMTAPVLENHEEDTNDVEEDGKRKSEEPVLKKDIERVTEVVTETKTSVDEVEAEVSQVQDTLEEEVTGTLKETITPIIRGLGF